jgi:hypothetical protein
MLGDPTVALYDRRFQIECEFDFVGIWIRSQAQSPDLAVRSSGSYLKATAELQSRRASRPPSAASGHQCLQESRCTALPCPPVSIASNQQ